MTPEADKLREESPGGSGDIASGDQRVIGAAGNAATVELLREIAVGRTFGPLDSVIERFMAEGDFSPLLASMEHAAKLAQLVHRFERHDEKLVQFISAHATSRTSQLRPSAADPDVTTAAPLAKQSREEQVGSGEAPTVKLGAILRHGGQFGMILFLISLFSWAYTDIPLINPYASVLGLVACPFFFVMGRIADRPTKSVGT